MDVSTLLAQLRRMVSAIHFMPRRETADMRRTFTDRAQVHRYLDQQHEAGFDCFVTARYDSWEVRCYKRRK